MTFSIAPIIRSLKSLYWLLAFVLLVQEIQSQTCFSTRFPRVLGGTLSSTTFQSVDKDSGGNIVVGGSTYDSSLSNLFNSPDPILLNIQYGNTYLWGVSFKGNNFDGVGAVKFSTAGTYIFAALTSISSSSSLTIAVVQSSNGQVVRALKYGGKLFKFHRIGQMIIDSTDKIYVGYQEVVLGGYNWIMQKFSPLSATPFVSPFKTSFKGSDKSTDFGAHTLAFTNSNAGILVSGQFSTSSSTTWSLGFAYFDISTADFKYIYAANTTDKLKRVTNLDVSSTSTAWGCGDFNSTDLLIFSVPVSTNVVPTGITTGLWTAQNIQCLGITAYTSIDSYLIAASTASSNDVRLIKASNVAGPSIQVSQYTFENTLSGASTNLVNGALFQQGSSKFYLIGNSKYFGGNLARSFSTGVGYIMETDYLSLGAQNQCLQLTLAYSASLILPSATTLIWSQAFLETRSYKTLESVTSDTSTVTQALKSLTLIDQASWCGPQTIVTFTTSPFTTQTYNVGVGGQTTSIIFSNFAIAQVCSDAVYSYTALMSTTAAALPSFLVFNPTLRSFDWSAAAASDAGTYNVDVTGKLNNEQTQVWPFTLIINSCATAVISTTSVSAISYYQNGSPTSVKITPFTSSISTASCGSINYSMEGPMGSGTLQAQYSFNSATMTLVINCNLCLADGTSQILKLTGTQGTISNFIQFTVTFLTSCTSASVIAPSQPTTMAIKVSDPIQTIPINIFSSSIKGCEVNLIYSCPGCSASLIFTFTSPNLMIKATTNEAVGTQQIEVYAYFVLPPSVFHTIVVTVNPDCTLLTPTGELISNFTYELSEGVQRVIANPTWETGINQCNSQINYALIDLDTKQPVDSQIIKLDQSPTQISVIPSTNATKARLYELSLQGSIGSSMAEVIFSIMITNLCPSAMALPEIILDQYYTLGDPSLTISFAAWKDSLGSNNCGTIYYSANANSMSLDQSWIKFDQMTRKFSIQTTNVFKVGKHTIKVFGKLASSGRISITSFQLTIIDPCETAYIIPSPMSSGLIYQATAFTIHPEMRYPFIKWKDDQAGKCEPIEYQISGLPDSYMTGTFTLDIKPLEGFVQLKLQGLIQNSTTLQVLITGTLKNGNSNSSIFSIVIIPDPFIIQLQSSIFKIDPFVNKNKEISPDLKMRLKSIDNKGMILIQFSKPLMQITNFSLAEDRQAFRFMIQGNGIASKARIVSWRIIEWRTYFIKIQLMIEDSDKISLGESQDQLKVVIKDPQFFRSSDAGSIILMNSMAQMKFPPQQSNTTFAKTFDQLTGGTKQVLSGTFALNFIICLIFGASMSNMWQLLNIVQILTMLPMLTIPYSSMFLTTTDILRTLAQFDILPNWLSFKYFRENILGVSSFDDLVKFNPLIETDQNSTKSRILMSSNQTSQVSGEDENGTRLISIGIESASIVMNLGSIGDMVIGMVLLSLAIQSFRLFFDCWSIFRNIYDFFAGILFFNAFIQASNQGYLYFSMVTLHSINHFSTNDKTFDRIFTVIMLIYIILYPIFTLIYLIRVQPKISLNENITASSGSFYDIVQTNHGRGPILNIFFFLIRRIILALSFYFLSEHKEFQIGILMLSSLAILIYQCHFKPFISKQDTFFEFFNEAILLTISYFLFTSLQFETRNSSLDYSILGLILCLVILNFCNFVYSSFRDLKVTCKNIGLKTKKFWNDLTKPKPCCNQAHQHSKNGRSNCSHNDSIGKKNKTVKMKPEIDFSESDKEETNEKLFKLKTALNQAKEQNPRARFVVVDLGSSKREKNKRKVIKEIQIENQAQEEESKQEEEDLTDITQSLKELKKQEFLDQSKQEEKESIDANFNKRMSRQKTIQSYNTNQMKDNNSPRQLSESNWSNNEWDQEKQIQNLRQNSEDDVTHFKIPQGRIYQEEEDDITIENENNERTAQDQKAQEEEKDYKQKLMFIHRVVKRRKQKQEQRNNNFWDQVIDL